MRLLEPAPMRPTTATLATPAMARGDVSNASMAASGGFGALMSEVSGDVTHFIEAGSGDGGWSATSGLSAEAQAYRAGFQSGPANLANDPAGAADAADASVGRGIDGQAQQDFLSAVAPWAEETGQRLGVAPNIVAAHAALESGWGARPLRQADGSDTHNLFGIKAGGGWQGDAARALTTEYEGGAALKRVERFRSYPDTGSAFRDYGQLLLDSPRFRGALNTGADAHAFAQGLARGGYATDPSYADKLSRLARRIQSAE